MSAPPVLPASARRPARVPGDVVIRIEGVTKLYRMGAETIRACTNWVCCSFDNCKP